MKDGNQRCVRAPDAGIRDWKASPSSSARCRREQAEERDTSDMRQDAGARQTRDKRIKTHDAGSILAASCAMTWMARPLVDAFSGAMLSTVG